MDLGLAGKVAIVTGVASGMGAQVSRLLAAEGARVVIADINEELGRDLAAELGDAALFASCDVTQDDQIERMVAAAVERFGGMPHLEFAMRTNASSITPVYLEPYMIKVFAEAKALLDPVRDADLIAEVDWFMAQEAQEAQHYRQHIRFNRCFQIDRYPELARLEKGFKDDLDRFFKEKSLAFNLAYAECFEAMGAVYYKVWLEELGCYREGAKEEALKLWDWHLAEEYEHREVAFKLYKAITARGSLWKRFGYGWLYRVQGLIFTARHIRSHTDPIMNHFMEVERADMTEAERAVSIAREKALKNHMARLNGKRRLAVFSPFYDPAGKPPPRGLAELLAMFEPGGYSRA